MARSQLNEGNKARLFVLHTYIREHAYYKIIFIKTDCYYYRKLILLLKQIDQ